MLTTYVNIKRLMKILDFYSVNLTLILCYKKKMQYNALYQGIVVFLRKIKKIEAYYFRIIRLVTSSSFLKLGLFIRHRSSIISK